MKKIFISGLSVFMFFMVACKNNSQTDSHTHDDGSIHSDHDTVKPKQEEFKITDTTHTDTTKGHTHEEGKKHSH